MAWKIDSSHSAVEFSVKHMMISTVRGRFTKFDGTINADPNNPLDAVVEGSVETASVDTHDAGRDAHLRSADFFDVERYPTMSFRSKRIERKGDEFKVVGDLTIRQTTREVVFNVADEGQNKDPWGNRRWGLVADAVVNRKDFGLTWNVALETGGALVAEQVKIHAEVELVYAAEAVAEAAA